jgi:DNA-directed RNA polymerase specialized sigma24 family protein
MPPGGRRARPTQLARPRGSAAAVPAPHARRCLTGWEAVRQHAAHVHALARRLLSEEADVEAVTRQVLLQVLRRPGACREKAALTAWLHRITLNAVLAHRRRLSRPGPSWR